MINKKRLVFLITERTLSMLEDIKEFKGYDTKTETVINSIRQYHELLFPVRVKKSSVALDNGEKYQLKQINKQNRGKIDREQGAKVCEMLGGKVSDNNLTCEYYTYNQKERYEQKIPLAMVTEDLLNYQYSPDKKNSA